MIDLQARTIQIFLPFGSPRGIKIAEITNRTVQAIYIPRNQLENAAKRVEVTTVGIYFLFGQSDADALPQVYIGEAENCLVRLKEHNRDKDFWESAIVFITNNNQNQFTKTDVKFLERLSFDTTKSVARYKINQTVPTNSFVPEWRQADLLDIFETIRVLVSTLGFPVFETVRKTIDPNNPDESKENLFFCKGKGLEALGEYSEDGFVILEGSKMAKDHSKSIHNYLVTIGKSLVQDQVVELDSDNYVFKKDHPFPSPSQAASVILGRNANGWIEWKNINGVTLDQIERKNID